jgi:sugar phosphate isomerase/epimerase
MSLHPSMPLNPASLKSIPVSFATVSIGKPTDPLPGKLSALASAGFTGIELGFPDLLTFASSHHGHEVGPKDFDDLVTAANEVKKLCDEKSLKIMLLQPFSNFEGWEEGSDEKKDAWERAEGWIRILEATDCETLQV